MLRVFLAVMMMGVASGAHAQARLSGDAPIEIVSDALEVLQNENKAIFTGNVIATQNDVNMRADKMTVFYKQSGGDDSASTEGSMGKGIDHIVSEGNVIFTSPTETAQGDQSIYTVATDTIDLTGNVFLTRDKNMLKGTKMVYNLKTGRSVLTGGVSGNTGGGRVRGLFVPGDKKE